MKTNMIKCPACGASVEPNGQSVVECPYNRTTDAAGRDNQQRLQICVYFYHFDRSGDFPDRYHHGVQKEFITKHPAGYFNRLPAPFTKTEPFLLLKTSTHWAIISALKIFTYLCLILPRSRKLSPDPAGIVFPASPSCEVR